MGPEDQMQMRILNITALGKTPDEDYTMTFNPLCIKFLAAQNAVIRGQAAKRVIVVYVEGDSSELFMSELDLYAMQQAVGSYAVL
jgi:hypothetical protein